MNTFIPVFDLDDTLYCEHDYVKSGFKAVAEYICNQNPTYKTDRLYMEFVNEWKANGRGKVFDLVCQNLDIRMNIQELVHVYRTHEPTINLYGDAKEILNFLKTRKIPIGLITDGDSVMQWNKINALDLQNVLDVIIVSNDIGSEYWKPSPVPYEMVAERLGVPVNHCIYIGDNPHKDFVTAKKLGMKTIRIIRSVGDHMNVKKQAEYEADKIIFSLKDFRKELGAI